MRRERGEGAGKGAEGGAERSGESGEKRGREKWGGVGRVFWGQEEERAGQEREKSMRHYVVDAHAAIRCGQLLAAVGDDQ